MCIASDDANLRVRMLGAELGNGFRHDEEAGRRPNSEGDRARTEGGFVRRLLRCLEQFGMSDVGPREESTTSGGGHDTFGTALNEPEMQLRFEASQTLAYRRLRHAQPAGC